MDELARILFEKPVHELDFGQCRVTLQALGRSTDALRWQERTEATLRRMIDLVRQRKNLPPFDERNRVDNPQTIIISADLADVQRERLQAMNTDQLRQEVLEQMPADDPRRAEIEDAARRSQAGVTAL